MVDEDEETALEGIRVLIDSAQHGSWTAREIIRSIVDRIERDWRNKSCRNCVGEPQSIQGRKQALRALAVRHPDFRNT